MSADLVEAFWFWYTPQIDLMKILYNISSPQDYFIGTALVTNDTTGAGFHVVEVSTGAGYSTMSYYVAVTDFSHLLVGEMYTIEVNSLCGFVSFFLSFERKNK